MISALMVNIEMFESCKREVELNVLEKLGVDIKTFFEKAIYLLRQSNLSQIQYIPAEMVREVICSDKVIDNNIDCFYWNSLTVEANITDLQFKEQIRESIIYHVRLLYVDLWGLAIMRGVPAERMMNLNKLPYGVFLDVRAA